MPDAPKTALLLAHSFPPISTAGVFRILRFVKYLPEFGWQPVVIASATRRGQVLRDERLLEQVPPGTIVQRLEMSNPEAWIGSLLRTGKPGGKSPNGSTTSATTAEPHLTAALPHATQTWRTWASKLQELLFRTPDENIWWVGPAVRAGLKAVRETNPDVIYTTGPPHSTHLSGLALRLLTGLPWVADFRDPWSRQPWGQKRNLWGAKLLPFIERECVRRASCVILNTGRMARDFQEHYHQFPKSKFVAIPNGFDPDLKPLVGECLRSSSVRAVGSHLRICHPGSLYHKRDLRPLLDAIRLLADSGLQVRFENVGDCVTRPELEIHVRKLGIEKSVVFENAVPHRDVLQRMANSDVLLVIQPDNALQVPGKLYEMMLFGKQILSLTDEGEVTDLVHRYELGEVARSNDAEDIARVIRRLAECSKKNEASSPKLATLEAFDGRLLTERLADRFDAVVRDFGSCGEQAMSHSRELSLI